MLGCRILALGSWALVLSRAPSKRLWATLPLCSSHWVRDSHNAEIPAVICHDPRSFVEVACAVLQSHAECKAHEVRILAATQKRNFIGDC